MSREAARLHAANEGLWADSVSEIEDAIRALQSTDTPGTEELSEKLFRRLKAFKAREEAKRGQWGELVLKREPGGLRHYLDGKPVHCGMGLILQATADKEDDFGGYTVPLEMGNSVGYEASHRDGKLDVTLHLYLSGHEFVTGLQPWMRFRWPKESWQR